MTYGRTPFQHITNQITKLHAIIDPSYEIEFPDIAEKDLQDVLKVTFFNIFSFLKKVEFRFKRWLFLY